MKVLVTGGLGYIGSHVAVELIKEGYEVIIIDDLSNSSESVLDGIEHITGTRPDFYNIDLKDKVAVNQFFLVHQDINSAIHFAASKAVGESVEQPLLYYENNLAPLIYLLQKLNKKEATHFIFSSSCTVYGEADRLPIDESFPIKPAESPYGNTKQIGEEILRDQTRVNASQQVIALRYFNPIGAHESGRIGELPLGTPQNLVPFITQTAIGLRKELSVFGDDYPTRDGTCIRDYIHVVDLAKAHTKALKRLIQGDNDSNYEVFNIGTGTGSTVMEVINAFEKVSDVSLNYKITPRRQGDVVAAYADTSKANEVLGWQAERDLKDALLSAWVWEQQVRS